MGALHEWLTDGITLEKSEAILAEYEREGWDLVSLSWDSEGGCFMGCWKRPKPNESPPACEHTWITDDSGCFAVCDHCGKEDSLDVIEK